MKIYAQLFEYGGVDWIFGLDRGVVADKATCFDVHRAPFEKIYRNWSD